MRKLKLMNDGISPDVLYSNLTISIDENASSGDYQIYFGKSHNDRLTVSSQVIMFSLQ